MTKKIIIEKKGRKEDKIEKIEEIEEVEGCTDSEDFKSADSGSSSGEEPEIIEKPKRKSNYVMTEARKKAFEKARQVRNEKIATRKAEKQKESEKYNKYKETLKQKKELKKEYLYTLFIHH